MQQPFSICSNLIPNLTIRNLDQYGAQIWVLIDCLNMRAWIIYFRMLRSMMDMRMKEKVKLADIDWLEGKETETEFCEAHG